MIVEYAAAVNIQDISFGDSDGNNQSDKGWTSDESDQESVQMLLKEDRVKRFVR